MFCSVSFLLPNVSLIFSIRPSQFTVESEAAYCRLQATLHVKYQQEGKAEGRHEERKKIRRSKTRQVQAVAAKRQQETMNEEKMLVGKQT